MKRKLLFAMLCIVGAWGSTYAIDWTDKTSAISNPSFETDDVVSDATTNNLSSASVTGWTVLPTTSVSNAQAAVVDKTSTLSVLNGSDGATAGSKYFYVRQNWNETGNFGIQQEIAAGQPEGLYLLTVKIKTSSNSPDKTKWYLSMQEEGQAAVVDERAGSAAEWLSNGVLLYKANASTKLTISAYMVAGASGGGQHYAMLLDDFQLKYISPDDLATINESNTLDLSGAIYNAGIYNANKSQMPRGWTAFKSTRGNSNFTEGTGDTQLEGWSGGNMDIDYYQALSNLPVGKYTVTARAHDTNDQGAVVYGWSNDGSGEGDMGAEYADVTTSAFGVINGTFNMGIKHNGGGSWVTGDNFRITYQGIKPLYDELKSNAETVLSNSDYDVVIGTERAELSAAKDQAVTSSYEGYLTAYNALKPKYDAFTAAKIYYDALVTEIAKAKTLGIEAATADGYAAASSDAVANVITKTQNLKVAEYNYVSTTYRYGVSLGEWNSTGTNTNAATFSNEHWSGTKHNYKNQNDNNGQGYNANSWSIDFNQNVTLPAGNYVFKVAGRQASGNQVNTSLIVKKGEETLGSISDFPRSNSSRGINKSGETAFEGDDSEFANGGKGFGWEWRYVKFSLDADATVNIAVNAVASAKYQWVSFGDYTLQTDNDANISLIAYNIALESAGTIIADAAYVNVIGTEKSELQAAIDADGTLDKSNKTDIDAAKDNLVAKTSAFTAAKSAYDAYVAAKAVEYANDKAYATPAKFTAIGTAQAAGYAASASDAETKTAAILTAVRQYYESHALAENVTGAVDKTDLIADPNFAGVTVDGTKAGGWTFDQTGGTAQVISTESFTDGSGNSSFNYFDYYNGGNNNQNIHQVISGLAPGHYMLTATGRGDANFNGNLQVYVVGKGNAKIPAIGNAGGVFNRGWNDASLEFYQTETGDVTIGAKTDNNKKGWWGVTRFRLVRLGDAVEKVSVTAAGLATYVSDVDLDYSEVSGLKAYKATVSGTTATLTPVTTVPAGEGVLLEGAEGTYSVPMTSGVAAWADEDNAFIRGTGVAVATGEGDVKSYILSTDEGGNNVGFYYANGEIVPKNRAYLQSTADAGARLTLEFEGGDANGIDSLENGKSNIENAAIYNLAGQRVKKAQKGLYIIGGKTVLVK